MKKVFIIHRWSGGANDDWRPWLKNELEQKGYEVIMPEMPNHDEPEITTWVSYLNEIVINPDENIFFIGHSIGCQAIMRYLQTLPENTKIGGAVFVAGWFNLAGLEDEGEDVVNIAKPWIETPINFDHVKKVCTNINVLISSNEPYNYIDENKKTFENMLNAKVEIIEDKGHFTTDDGVTKLPEILKYFD